MASDKPDAPPSASSVPQAVPIAQLCPELPNQSTRDVEGEITVVWPYSLVTKSIAFKLVETDFRLRRDKGQVRIDFHGAVGKAVSDAVLEGGDTVRLSLDGVAWEKASLDAPARPGAHEWQLRFTNRLRLHARRAETRDEVTIDIDASEADNAPEIEIPRPITPVNEASPPGPDPSDDIVINRSTISSLPAKRLASTTFDADEYSSPAFLKRARVSYGSLFEGGLDIFMEGQNGSSRRKRPRYSMNSNWKYSSRTPSPEPEEATHPEEEDGENEENSPIELSKSSPATGTHLQQTAASQTLHSSAKSPTPTRLLSPSQTTSPTTNTQIPSTSEPEAALDGFPKTELAGRPFMTGYVGFTNEHGPSPAFAASQPGEALVQPMQVPHSNFQQSHSITPLEDVSTSSMPGMSSVISRDITLETPQEDLPFLDGDYHMDISHTVHDGHVQGFHQDVSAIFPLASNAPTHETHPVGPFASQHLNHLPWTDLVQPSTSAYPPPPNHNDRHAAVEIIDSSSPPRQPSEAASVSRELEEGSHTSEGDQQVGSNEDVDSDEVLEEDRADFEVDENESEEGPDLPGDDYDLRNYDRTKDDDEVEPEVTPEPSSDDPDEQIAKVNPQGDLEPLDESGSEVGDDMAEESDEGSLSGQPVDAEASHFDDEEVDDMDPDDEDGAEEYDEEDEYSDGAYDDEGGDEEEHAASRTPASQEPVVIDLLSDSEDENEAPAAASASVSTSTKPPVEFTAQNKTADDKMEEDDPGHYESESEPEANQEEPSSPKPDEDDSEQGNGESEEEINVPNHSVVSQLLSAAKEVESDHAGAMDVDKEAMEDRLVSMDGADDPRARDAVRESSESLRNIGEQSLQASSTMNKVEGEAVVDSSSIGNGESEAKVGPQGDSMPDVLMNDSTSDSPTAQKDAESDEEMITEVNVPVAMPSQGSPPSRNISAEVEGSVERSESLPTAMISSLGNSTQLVSATAATAGKAEGSDLAEPDMQEAVALSPQTRPEREGPSLTSQPENLQKIPAMTSTEDQPQSEESTTSKPKAVVDDTATKELPERPTSGHPTAQRASIPDFAVAAERTQTLPEKETGQEAAQVAEQKAEAGFKASSTSQAKLDSPVQIEASSPEQHLAPADQAIVDAKPTAEDAVQPVGHESMQSPPPSQISPDKASQEFAAPGQDSESAVEQRPTPKATIQSVDDKTPVSPVDTSFDDEVTAEQQIIAESQEYQHALSQVDADMPDSDHAQDGASQTLAGPAKAEKDKPVKARRDRDILITVQSLRSWDHRRSLSSDAGGNEHSQDPSILLAKAPTPPATEASREDVQPRTATNNQLQDPSIALARASAPSTAASSREDAKSRMTVHVTRSMVDHADPSLDLARAPNTPRKSARRHGTPDRSLDMPSLSQSTRNKTPETTANDDVPNTPSVVGSTAEDEQISTLKRKLTRDLRTNLPEYLQVKAIRNHQKKVMDVMGVVTKTPLEPYRPKNGPRDYMLEVIITDHAASPNNVVVAQLFRPRKTSLPTVQAGDVVIFRQFQTQPLNKRGVGLRTVDESSWAVFEKGDEEMLPQIKGPPVELSDAEVAHAEGLRRWWGLLDSKTQDKLAKATEKVVQNPKADTK